MKNESEQITSARAASVTSGKRPHRSTKPSTAGIPTQKKKAAKRPRTKFYTIIMRGGDRRLGEAMRDIRRGAIVGLKMACGATAVRTRLMSLLTEKGTCGDVQSKLAELAPACSKDAFWIKAILTSLASQSSAHSLTEDEMRKLWRRVGYQWQAHRQQETQATKSARSIHFSMGMRRGRSETAGATGSRDRFKATNEAYWAGVAAERRKNIIWARQALERCSAQDCAEVGGPSTAGSISVQEFSPDFQTPRKAMRNEARQRTPKKPMRNPLMGGQRRRQRTPKKKRLETKKQKINVTQERLIQAATCSDPPATCSDPPAIEGPSTAGSDPGGDLLCLPSINVAGSSIALPPGPENDDLLTAVF